MCVCTCQKNQELHDGLGNLDMLPSFYIIKFGLILVLHTQNTKWVYIIIN